MVNPLVGLVVPLAWAAFVGAALLSVTLGAILAYHWFRYGLNPAAAMTATITYTIVSGLLLSGILAAAVAIQIAY